MKNWFALIPALLLSACAMTQPPAVSNETHRLHHLVIVWLKQPGNDEQRRQYIEASRSLAKLPGVLAYDVGTPAQILRRRANAALDESYDVAISAVYENQQALEVFLQHPDYVKTAQQVLRPLVDKYRVYDFVEE